MKRTEIFPYKERQEMIAEIMNGCTDSFNKTEPELRIYRLKQLLLKYFHAVPSKKWDNFTYNCPLCQSYSGSSGIYGCARCPWAEWYSNLKKQSGINWKETYCECWARTIGHITINNILADNKARKKRINMIYKWIEKEMERL